MKPLKFNKFFKRKGNKSQKKISNIDISDFELGSFLYNRDRRI